MLLRLSSSARQLWFCRDRRTEEHGRPEQGCAGRRTIRWREEFRRLGFGRASGTWANGSRPAAAATVRFATGRPRGPGTPSRAPPCPREWPRQGGVRATLHDGASSGSRRRVCVRHFRTTRTKCLWTGVSGVFSVHRRLASLPSTRAILRSRSRDDGDLSSSSRLGRDAQSGQPRHSDRTRTSLGEMPAADAPPSVPKNGGRPEPSGRPSFCFRS